MPTTDIAAAELAAGITAFELMHRAGLVQSKGGARKLIRSGGGRINDRVIADEQMKITTDEVAQNGMIKLSAGRKRHALIRPV